MRPAARGISTPMQIRAAAPSDLADIQAIYAHHVLTGTGTFEEVPPSVEQMQARMTEVTGAGWAWLVASDATGVTGYGYYARLRSRSAYRFSAEDSVYVRPDVHGQGVGKALVAALIAHAEAAGFRQMFAVIGDADNVGSIGLHVSLGFRQVGRLRAAGFKFGRWLDSITMQRALGAGDSDVPA